MQKFPKILLFLIPLLAILTVTTILLSSAVFFQLFIAFIIAYLLNPAVEALEKKGIRRFFGILIVFSIAIIMCSAFALFLTFSIHFEFSRVQINLPAYIRHLYEITPVAIKSFLGIETPDKMSRHLNELVDQLRGAVPGLLKPALFFLQSLFSSTISAVLIFM